MESTDILNSGIKSNFLVQFETDLIPDLEYYVRTIPLPGYNISTNTVHSTSAQPVKYYGGMITWNDISFDIIIDEKYTSKKAIDGFMFLVRDQFNGILDQQHFDVSLYQLSNKSNPINKIKFYRFLPETVGDIVYDVTGDSYGYFTWSGSIVGYEWLPV